MTNRPNLTEEEKEYYNKIAMDMFHNKTPRTDKAEPQIRFIKSGWVRSDFARELELELNALKKKLDDSKFGAQCSVHELEYDRKTLIKENAELKEGNIKIMKKSVHPRGSECDEGYGCMCSETELAYCKAIDALKKQRDKAIAIAEELVCHCSGEMYHSHVKELEKLKKKIKKLDTSS